MTIPEAAVENHPVAVENRIILGIIVVNRHMGRLVTEFGANEPIHLIAQNIPESVKKGP